MGITFERLKEVHLAERESPSLTKIEPDFYKGAVELLEELKKEAESEENRMRAIMLHESARRILEEIVVTRMGKIYREVVSGREPSNLVSWEEEYYRELRLLVEKYLSSFLDLARREKKKELNNVVMVRILRDVPQFVGPDGKEYGPFVVGEETPLPREVAKVLIVRGMAEVIR